MFVEKLPMKKSGQPSGWWEDNIKYCFSEFGLAIGSSLLTISGHCINGI